jgi:hypothetical protein
LSFLDRPDVPPPGLLEAGREELEAVYGDLDRQVGSGEEFICGELSIADPALFPHLSAVRFLGAPITRDRHPRLAAWYDRMKELPICRADLGRARAWLTALQRKVEKVDRIVWRGDRIEWLLAHGIQDWFFGEIEAGRVGWPRR